MNTMEDEDFDYQVYTRETPPDPAKIQRGTAARARRLEAAMSRGAVRVEAGTLSQFEQLVGAGQDVEQVINRALREWLEAQGLRELLRAEIQSAVRQSMTALPSLTPSLTSNAEFAMVK